MACRFPDANTPTEFWTNLASGVESVSTWADEDLLAEGVPAEEFEAPGYVKASAALTDVDMFDAEFFRLTPREAQVTDPQQRLFLECAWEAMEDAGYAPTRITNVGVFASASRSTYERYLRAHENEIGVVGGQRLVVANERDFIPAWVSYKLDLRGPSVTVQTACSSSLTAVHLAWQSLVLGECAMALAGGVSIYLPQKQGYLYQPGGILSPDGHSRTFDARAQGTVRGNGLGIVVMKRLSDAVHDGDVIRAVIKGSALNNDGAGRIGFTSPGVDGQTAAITRAFHIADVSADSVSYVEAHGTATILGDPIEVQALTAAFRQKTIRNNFCALGSVKTNIGHLDAAAGIAGLIKTVLALQHRQIPPSLHFATPNPQMHLDESPFYVNAKMSEWPGADTPRRAGVSSIGLGGTNVHVVLEEAPEAKQSGPGRPWQLLSVSAKSSAALRRAEARLKDSLAKADGLDLADIAFTLHVGRVEFAHRRVIVCQTLQEAIEALDRANSGSEDGVVDESRPPRVVFLFPGQGSHRIGMGRGLYQSEPIFKATVDECAAVLQSQLDLDIREYLFPTQADAGEAALRSTRVAQPALFTFEYALAQLLIACGIRPHALVGHSLGEYVAACLAGSFSLKDALRLVAARGELMESTAPGAMLMVNLSKDQLMPLLGADLSLAAVNAPSLSVVSGTSEAIRELHSRLSSNGVYSAPLEVNRAFHSVLMDPILDPFSRCVETISLRPPTIPVASNVTGQWATKDEYTHATYWVEHVRKPVQFAPMAARLLKDQDLIFLDLGPKPILGTLMGQQRSNGEDSHRFIAVFPKSEDSTPEAQALLKVCGRLWLKGAAIDWLAFYSGQSRKRISLLPYPFERRSYWLPLPKPQQKHVNRSTVSALTNTAVAVEMRERNNIVEERKISPNDFHVEKIWQTVSELVRSLTGRDIAEFGRATTFYALGADSLILIQLASMIHSRLGVKIPYRVLFEEVTTLEALVDYLDRQIQSQRPTSIAAPLDSVGGEATSAVCIPSQDISGKLHRTADTYLPPVDKLRDSNTMATKQSASVRRMTAETQQTVAPQQVLAAVDQKVACCTPLPAGLEHADESYEPPKGILPDNPSREKLAAAIVNTGTFINLNERQLAYLEDFTRRYNLRTKKSKLHVGSHRNWFAEARSSMGFRKVWKELIYPIVSDQAIGSRFCDLDGNEYVDLTMGFGAELFGHAPSFVTDAIRKQLTNGVQLGPESTLTGEAARLICEITGAERVGFCSTGTEAIMGALRLARATTGKVKIALFEGAYHGTFDGVLARRGVDKESNTGPAALGTPPSFVADTIVLPYLEEQSLDFIKAHAGELAAVLVEPVPSRCPDQDPTSFLAALREHTDRYEIALILDEIVTGFRCHLRGVQGMFGIQADIATYGKVLGGGMPIGVVAGKADYLNAIDGGAWNYADSSGPTTNQTIFAGTFWKHPLSMAACVAVLRHLQERGPSLQLQLTGQTAELVASINAVLNQYQAPVTIAHFGSQFYWRVDRRVPYVDLFFYHLLMHGVYVWEGRTSYLSTAHTSADCNAVIKAVRDSLQEMASGGLLPPAQTNDGPRGMFTGSPSGLSASCGAVPQQIPLTIVQQQMWFVSQMHKETAKAPQSSVTAFFHGRLDVNSLQRSLAEVITRHDALRTTISPDGKYQVIHPPAASYHLSVMDFSRLTVEDRETESCAWLHDQLEQPADLARGPLFRCWIHKMTHTDHRLIIIVHHIIIDGRSFGVLFDELAALYNSYSEGVAPQLPPVCQFREFVTEERAPRIENEAIGEWDLSDDATTLAVRLPSIRDPQLDETYRSSRYQTEFSGPLVARIRQFCGQKNSTLYCVLLAGYHVLLHRLSKQDCVAVGINVLQNTDRALSHSIGYGVNPSTTATNVSTVSTFAAVLEQVKKAVLIANDNSKITVNWIQRHLKHRLARRRPFVVSTSFNLDRADSDSSFHGLYVEIQTNPPVRTVLDLSVNATDCVDTIRLECDYKSECFEGSAVATWMRDYYAILAAMVAHPDRSIWHDLGVTDCPAEV